MAVATSDPLIMPFTMGSAKMGQGTVPLFWLLYSTDDLADSTPNWLDASQSLRSFSTSRGRTTELDEVDAGQMTLNLDNTSRQFDPIANANVRPRNRWWLREQFNGLTNDVFKGYAKSYDQTWPDKTDAVAVVNCTDEFSILSRDSLPLLDPQPPPPPTQISAPHPVSDATYSDVVMFDKPSSYWPMNDDGGTAQFQAAAGTTLINVASLPTNYTNGPIVGDLSESGNYSMSYTGTNGCNAGGQTATASETPDCDVSNLSGFSIEGWIQINSLPSGTAAVFVGPLDISSVTKWELRVTTTGQLQGFARDNGAVTTTITSSAVTLNVWHHVVLGLSGGTLTLYIDGVSAASGAFGGTFNTTLENTGVGSTFTILSATGMTIRFAHVAFYPSALTTTRINAHITAALNRGFPQQPSASRFGAVLDSTANRAPRFTRSSGRNTVPVMMHGQDPLTEIRNAREVELADGVLFTASDGTLVLLDSAHRSNAPWNTVQAVFDDDGTDLPYQELDVDYSDSYLVNECSVTRPFGRVQTSTDATSMASYGPYAVSLNPPLTTDFDSLAVASAVVTKYKDPITRVLTIAPKMVDVNVLDAVMQLDLADKVRVFRTPPPGIGTRIDQSVWVQSINTAWSASVGILNVNLGVSPR